jgi:motility quorum-sensing regulator/GCU-specific mRNA interferase toxin
VEKKKPHYPLAAIKQALANRQVRVTTSALQGAFALGLLDVNIWDAVEGLKPGDFYKSMTTHHDHRTWQDVYHAQVADLAVYLKIQYVTDPKEREGYWVISFKKR